MSPGLTAAREPRSPFLFEAPVVLGAVDVRPGVRICAHTYMNSGRIESGVYIGRYCSIGFDVHLGTGHHDMNLLSTSSWFSSIAPPSVKTAEADVRVRIKNDVWIGDGAIIMSGVTIGNGAVIGAGAVVTKDVPDYAVMIGVPARLLRYRFSAEIMHRLLALKWWELDDQLLKKHQLNNIQASLEYLESLPEEARTAKNLALQRI